jgi:hypothetical protein
MLPRRVQFHKTKLALAPHPDRQDGALACAATLTFEEAWPITFGGCRQRGARGAESDAPDPPLQEEAV